MNKKSIGNDFLEKVQSASKKVSNAMADTASNISESTFDAVTFASEKINGAIDEKKAAAEKARREQFEAAILPIRGTEAESFVAALGDSPVNLTNARINQIKAAFPIPREQNILWADAEFDLRPSGIVVTDRGVFIRTNVGMLDRKIGVSNFMLDELNGEEQQAFLQNHAQFHSGKAVLIYYNWDDFEPGWFVSESELDNRALLVEPQCSKRFINVCRNRSIQSPADTCITAHIGEIQDDDRPVAKASIAAGAAIESAQVAVFAEQKSYINTPAGHGEMAEEAINMMDRLHGLDAKVIGRDNARNGADRQIGDILIQTKYYNSARGSLEACFDPETGKYRYINEDTKKPMQLEVPKDQYQQVLDGFKKKIESGKVPGIKDPNDAVNIVRKGRLTYQKAVNLTKPGTIQSLSYDALTGAVTCSCAFGITFVITVFLTWRKTGDLMQAIQAGASAGLQVFGISFIQHMVVSQIARTGLANSLLGPSQYVVSKLGYQASATLVNGIRTLSGKSAIYGAAAAKNLAKILRSNVLTSALSFAVFSIPETYNVASRRISSAQYSKNMSILAGSIAAGTGGAVAAGIVAAKVAGVAGTVVAPGMGTVVGIAGGFIGGAVGAKAIEFAGDFLHEDDVETLGRMFNAYVSCMIGEYFLDEFEIDKLVARLNKIKPKEFKSLFESIEKSKEQEAIVRGFLIPHFDAVAAERSQFMLPSPESIVEAIAELVE